MLKESKANAEDAIDKNPPPLLPSFLPSGTTAHACTAHGTHLHGLPLLPERPLLTSLLLDRGKGQGEALEPNQLSE